MKKKYVHTSNDIIDSSPSVLVPIIVKLFKPESLVDVGCGIGNWLKEFENNNVSDLFGIDGTHLDRSLFLLNSEKLMLLDLEKPFSLDRKFDVAISLEVAEHLKADSANDFVRSLCSLSDIVVFSAAVPGQGGQNHLNEQWPSFWKKKFEENGYYFNDVIRPLIWINDNVRIHYRQNIFVASKKPVRQDFDISPIIDMLHPDMLQAKMTEAMNGEFGARFAANSLRKSVALSLRNRFKK